MMGIKDACLTCYKTTWDNGSDTLSDTQMQSCFMTRLLWCAILYKSWSIFSKSTSLVPKLILRDDGQYVTNYKTNWLINKKIYDSYTEWNSFSIP